MNYQKKRSAVVIGASMAGLVTARVLSDHFDKVYLMERDPILDRPESRKGQPHTRHIHTLLASGLLTLQKYFPDLKDCLKKSGATVCDPGQSMVWNCYGGYRTSFELGEQIVFTSRPFLEYKIRQRVLQLKNVELMSNCSVDKLLTDSYQEQVIGIKITNNQTSTVMSTDLVVDASGRGSCSSTWLKELGYDEPEESKVSCKTGYTSRIYQRNPEKANASKWVAITPEAPKEQRGGGAFPVEGNRWMVSLFGWHGDHPVEDEAGFEAFAKSLPSPDLYNIITQNEPVSGFFVHKFPCSLRRYYEKMDRFPQGYLVLGDAVCSFNPIYGQGMTSSILQAATLDKLLKERKDNLQDIAKPYFRKIAKVIDVPWQIAVGEDFRYQKTSGKKPLGIDLINTYLSRVHRTTHSDPVVCKAFMEVLNMLKPPLHLFRPSIMIRVLRSRTIQQPLPKPAVRRQLAKV